MVPTLLLLALEFSMTLDFNLYVKIDDTLLRNINLNFLYTFVIYGCNEIMYTYIIADRSNQNVQTARFFRRIPEKGA